MYAQSTVKRTATTVRNMNDAQKRLFCDLLEEKARQQAAKRPVKATVKADRDAWKNDPSIKASKKQMDRINIAYGALGRRQYRTLAQFRAVFASAGEASAEFQRSEVKAAYWAAR